MKTAAKQRHTFSFNGGDLLTSIGVTFFISYLYYLQFDRTHRNWESVATRQSRISTIDRSKQYHQEWLERVDSMSEAKLNTNSLGLKGSAVKMMARAIIKKQQTSSNAGSST
jgi:hypothetical protein